MTDAEIDNLWLEAFKASSDDGKVRQRFAELCYQRGEWQPIDTAPKDGLLALLCTDGGIVFVGKLNKHLQLWVDDQGRERFRTVSYWMPLPAPPESAPNVRANLPP